ncbi:SOSS complex subunit C homolog [Hyalella azteca]|uniref:SOSS complex subunit C homolog n=1 Tax=Hyalella azteca TaxID=294128 RepID=A0A8B7NW86_HYAAZ|nr:SOSS complex subunit C homolog [Hyalella azteca]
MAAPTVPPRDSVTSSSTSNPQRKILEDLQFKKQMFLKQGASQALAPATTVHQSTGWQSGTDGHLAGTATSQRPTLLSATTHSFGYFIPTDSSFGNFILPVLPRLDPTPPAKPVS